MRWSRMAGVVVAVVALCCVADVVRRESGPTVLMEVDGIQLDSNAAAVLASGSDSARHSGMMSPSTNPTDKMLHAHESGELDGVALDANAASVLLSPFTPWPP